MSEFVVGQWVECVNDHCTNLLKKGQFYRVGQDPRYNGCGVYIEEVKALFGSKIFRPVEWQVGKTYRTTLEGVTATIAKVSCDSIHGSRSDKAGNNWMWHRDTGKMELHVNDNSMPHLTPYLADEPSPAVETTEPSKQVEPQPTTSRYHRTINGATFDLYDVAEAYGLESHRIFHAVKKLVMAGRRGHKDREQDLREAIVSIESELQKMKGGAS